MSGQMTKPLDNTAFNWQYSCR